MIRGFTAVKPGTCAACGAPIRVGERIREFRKLWRHLPCAVREIEEARRAKTSG